MRAIWSGAISFGLVNIPVQMFLAVQDKSISFHQLHKKDMARIKYHKFCGLENIQVEDDEIAKAYEYEKGKYVIISEDELANADPDLTGLINISDFVAGADIDPIFFKRPYYLEPQSGGEKAYQLLYEAMAKADKVAIGQCVIRTRQYLVTVRPKEDNLVLETMHYPDEIVTSEAMRSARPYVDLTREELAMAESLIDKMTGPFEPLKFKEEFRETILDVVERKVAGEEVVAPQAPTKVVPVLDLVSALKSSLEELKKTGS